LPYIEQSARAEIDAALDLLIRLNALMPLQQGELNYTLTRLLKVWLGPNPNYAAFNSAVGVLENVKLELYRRQVAPYEDRKLGENGDVHGS
jgi:hypothetical protein